MSEQDYFVQFAHELGELNGNLVAVLKRIEERMAKNDEMMAKHEARISMLEGRALAWGDGGGDWRRLAMTLVRYGGWVLLIVAALLKVRLPAW